MTSEPTVAADASTPSLRTIMVVLLRGRRLIIGLSLGLGLAVGVSALMSKAQFRSGSAFFAQSGQGDMSGLAGLAGQFGFRIPGVETGQGPDFFHVLLFSREIMTDVVDREYTAYSADDSAIRRPLLDILSIEAPSEAERLGRGLDWMRRRALTASVQRETGIVRFSIVTGSPDLSFEMATNLLEAMHRFNNRTRRTQARAEREFLEGRLEVAEGELLKVEAELQAFLQQNRLFADSPELLFRHDRLQRQVVMRQQVYTGLIEAHEQARIREVRDTPILTVVEQPIRPPRREPRGTVKKGLLGMIFGAGLAIIGLLFIPSGRTAVGDAEAAALGEAWAEARADALRVLTLGSRGG